MFLIRKFYLIVFALTVTSIVYGQAEAEEEKPCQVITNKKAIKAYKEGINRKNKKEDRIKYLLKALELEPDYVDANFAYATERIKTLISKEAEFVSVDLYFRKVIEICPKYHSDPYYYLGFSAYEQEKWADCIDYLKKYLKFRSDDDKKFNKYYDDFLDQSKTMISWAKFYNEIYNKPVPFDPYPLPGVCTELDEYLPTISPDGQKVFFTRKQPHVKRRDDLTASDTEDEFFSYSNLNSATGEYDKGRPMQYPFNQGSNEGGATVSVDNKHLFFTICKSEGGAGSNCDIYFSDYIDYEWTVPQKVPGINDPDAWDSQPSLASDGKTLYFASNRRGGYGGVDIYRTVKDFRTGVWSKPENLGKPVNTNGNEFSPFLHSDFHSLYFSSDGHPSVGGKDIFFSKMIGDSVWSDPRNLGVPINTTGDDMGFFVSTDGHYGYFASNQASRVNGKGNGRYDVYYFKLYKEIRPEEVVFIKGKVDDNAKSKGENFSVEIKDAVSKRKTDALVDTVTGEYTAIVRVEKEKNDLIVTVNKEGAAFSSQLITKEEVEEMSTNRDEDLPKGDPEYKEEDEKKEPSSITASLKMKPIKSNLQLDTLKVGQAYTLNNIYYNTNSSQIDPRSVLVIEEFVEYLIAHPTIKIEIHGHTDNVGRDKENLVLSTDRASTVRDLIIEKGIDKSRIAAFKGFGASKPVADNETEQGRAKNRRTEFLIVEK